MNSHSWNLYFVWNSKSERACGYRRLGGSLFSLVPDSMHLPTIERFMLGRALRAQVSASESARWVHGGHTKEKRNRPPNHIPVLSLQAVSSAQDPLF